MSTQDRDQADLSPTPVHSFVPVESRWFAHCFAYLPSLHLCTYSASTYLKFCPLSSFLFCFLGCTATFARVSRGTCWKTTRPLQSLQTATTATTSAARNLKRRGERAATRLVTATSCGNSPPSTGDKRCARLVWHSLLLKKKHLDLCMYVCM